MHFIASYPVHLNKGSLAWKRQAHVTYSRVGPLRSRLTPRQNIEPRLEICRGVATANRQKPCITVLASEGALLCCPLQCHRGCHLPVLAACLAPSICTQLPAHHVCRAELLHQSPWVFVHLPLLTLRRHSLSHLFCVTCLHLDACTFPPLIAILWRTRAIDPFWLPKREPEL